MALTTSSRFGTITITYENALPASLTWSSDAPAPDNYSSILISTLPTGNDLTNLQALQSIYDNGDGEFLDPDGNAVEVIIDHEGPPTFTYTDLADLEPNGYVNPLIAGYENRITIVRDLDAVWIQQASISEDAVSGRKDIALQAGLVPTRRRPPLQMKYDLHDWIIIPDHNLDTRFYLRYFAAKNRQLATATCGTHAAVRALVKYLYDHRSGGDLGSTGPYSLTGLTSAIDGTIYTIDQNNNDDLIFQVTNVSLSLVENYISLRCDLEDTSEDLSVTALYDTLQGEAEFNIVVNSAEEHPPTSAKDAPTHAYRYHFDDEYSYLRVRNAHPIFKGKTDGGHHYELPFGYGRVIEFNDLIEHQGARVLPADYAIGTIHYDATHDADGELRLISPQSLLPVYGTEWPFAIHNKNADYNLAITDPQGNNVGVLLPGEILHLRASRERTGADEYVDDVPFVRSIRYSGGAGNMGQSNVLHLDSTREIHQVPLPSTPTYQNAEVFDTEGSDVWLNANNWVSQDDWHTAEAVKMSKAGSLRWTMQVSVRNNGSGIIPSGHQFRLYRQSGSGAPTSLRTQTVGQVGGNKSVTWFNTWEGPVAVDDILFAVWVYSDSDTTATLSNVQLQEVALEMYLTQVVRL